MDAQNNAESLETSNNVLPLQKYARQVYAAMNDEYYRVMLAAFEKAAFGHGFIFINGIESIELSTHEKGLIAREVMIAKVQHIAPKIDEHDLAASVNRYMEDGEGDSYVDGFLSALSASGIVLCRRPGWSQITLE